MVSFLFFVVMLLAHEVLSVFNNLPDDAKVNIAQYLGSHSNGLLKQTNNANSRIVDTVREDELREIAAEYKQTIDETDMTAEMIQSHFVPIPGQDWQRLSGYPLTVCTSVLERGSFADNSGSYLLFKLLGHKVIVTQEVKSTVPRYRLLRFTFQNGLLHVAHYFDGKRWSPAVTSNTHQIQFMYGQMKVAKSLGIGCGALIDVVDFRWSRFHSS